MRVTMNDGRQMTGQMLAFDKVRLTLSNIKPPLTTCMSDEKLTIEFVHSSI
jgi:hypothetical protein